jgi:hypothetical protein
MPPFHGLVTAGLFGVRVPRMISLAG